MSIKTRYGLYLVLVHGIVALGMWLVYPHDKTLFFVFEALLCLSLLLGVTLFPRLNGTARFLKISMENLEESQFTTRLRLTGSKELDPLIEVYNRMIASMHHERLRLGEQRSILEKLMEVTPTAILIFDFDGGLHLVNPSAQHLLNLADTAWQGLQLGQINSPLAQALHQAPWDQPVVLPFKGQRRLKCSKSRFIDRGFKRTFIVLEEVTEEVRHSERAAYGRVIRLMSHEVNNSMGATSSLLKSCLNYAGDLKPEDRDDYRHAIQVVIERLANLNHFMRDFAEVVKLPAPRKTATDLVPLLEDLLRLVSAECTARNISLEHDLPSSPVVIDLDRQQMEQALVNILKNAMEAIEGAGKISVRLHRTRRSTILSIEDSGRALTPEVSAQLFKPFFSTKASGQGIGLTMVGQILASHGFDYALEGDGHRDTCFTIEMPA